jgi:hypothetical protein
MIKAVVVARDYSQFTTYIRNRRLNREEYGCWRGKEDDCIGLDGDTVKVLWLEGWSENERIKASDIEFLKEKFSHHKNIPEGWIYNENFSF